MESASNGKTSAHEAKEMFELKRKAMQYYAENGVPQKMEHILNSTFYDNPDDVFGHLASYFEGFAKPPVITKVVAREALDGKGQFTVQTEIYGTVKNHQKMLSSSLSSNESYPPDTVKPEERDTIESDRQNNITRAVELINSEICQALEGKDPVQQEDIDIILMNTMTSQQEAEEELLAREKEEMGVEGAESGEKSSARSPHPSESKAKAKSPKGKNKGPAVVVIPEEPREKLICGCNAVSALSQAVACAGASLKGEPLYKHIASLHSGEVPQSFHVPLPMVTIMMSGKMAPGKLNCIKEYMVVPKPEMPLKESLKHIVNIYNHCAKVLSAKIGITGKAVNDLGALWATFDRPEQGLDLIQEAITQQELKPGEDFNIALNCAGQEIFDYEKGKYEVVTGQLKQAEDLADYWADLLGRYPSVIALIDPMRKQECEAWMKLCEKVSEKCFVIGDVVYHRPGLLKDEELSPDFRSSGVVLRLEQMNSISDILTVVKKMEDADTGVVIGAGVGESPDTFIADLAVGCGARFLKLGAPCRGERISKLNRLLQIESCLTSDGKLATLDAHVFPLVKPPSPPPPEDQDGQDKSDSNPADKKD